MLYQLPDGRTVEISLELYLQASDEEIQSLIGMNFGVVLNNPMYGSVISKPGKPEPDTCDQYTELPDATSEEKFEDQDYIADEE